MSRPDTDVAAPLSRQSFESIVYNAVGRASEINTYPAYALSHSTGNSGWSVGIVQWDFGQPGRGHKVDALLRGYQDWAQPADRFDSGTLASLAERLQRRGQSGNALDEQEKARLDAYLRSGDGRIFVDGLNTEQLDYKWREIGNPLAATEWLATLQESDPAQVVEIMSMANKLFNQNEIRGRRLRDHLLENPSTSGSVREWIGNEGIAGLNPAARKAILSGRDQALAGARLLNALQSGDSLLSDRWREIVHRGDHTLARGFEFNHDLQLFDAMLRHPTNGLRLLRQVEGAHAPRDLGIRGINALSRLEMATVHADAAGGIAVTTTRGTTLALQDAGWRITGPSLAARRPADQPDYTEGARSRPLLPPGRQEHPEALELQRRIMELYEERGHTPSAMDLETATALVLRDAQRDGGGRISHLAFGAAQSGDGPGPTSTIIAWRGNPRDPATMWTVTSLEPVKTPLAEIWRDIDIALLLRQSAAACAPDQSPLYAQPAPQTQTLS